VKLRRREGKTVSLAELTFCFPSAKETFQRKRRGNEASRKLLHIAVIRNRRCSDTLLLYPLTPLSPEGEEEAGGEGEPVAFCPSAALGPTNRADEEGKGEGGSHQNQTLQRRIRLERRALLPKAIFSARQVSPTDLSCAEDKPRTRIFARIPRKQENEAFALRSNAFIFTFMFFVFYKICVEEMGRILSPQLVIQRKDLHWSRTRELNRSRSS